METENAESGREKTAIAGDQKKHERISKAPAELGQLR